MLGYLLAHGAASAGDDVLGEADGGQDPVNASDLTGTQMGDHAFGGISWGTDMTASIAELESGSIGIGRGAGGRGKRGRPTGKSGRRADNASLGVARVPQLRKAPKGRAYSAKVQDDIASGDNHAFNRDIDSYVISHGVIAKQEGSYVQYAVRGTFRGRDGVFQVGGYWSGKIFVITHHLFKP